MANESSTQQLVDVSEIREDVIILKNGSIRSVVEVSAINFELRSEDEQIALLQSFQNFLNSVDFPIQILIHSRKMDIEDYLKYADDQAAQLDELLKIQAAEYIRFVKELSSLANIMSKKFYVVVPFYIYENPQKAGFFKSLTSVIKPSKTLSHLTDEQFSVYRNQLRQRAELILDSLTSLGLKTQILESDDLVKTLYRFYSPGENLKSLSSNG